jgi:hypothetical protein
MFMILIWTFLVELAAVEDQVVEIYILKLFFSWRNAG